MKKLWIALLLVGALAGAPWALTHALFTDSASIGSNTFSSGTVDISTSPTSALVTYSNMAPGDSVTNSLTVTNAGTLALRYAIASSATNADSKGLKDQLTLTVKTADVVTVDGACNQFDGTQLYTGDLDSSDGKIVGDSASGAQSGDRSLNSSANETLCVKVLLPSSSGNSFQNATTTATFTFDAEQTANN